MALKQLILFCLAFNSLFSVYTWLRFYKKRILYDNRYGMTISMTSSMIISVILSMQFTFSFSFTVDMNLGIMAITGAIIGAAFGSLIRMHAVLSGITAGVMGSLMGAMSGSVIMNPALCGLPIDNTTNLLFNMSVFTAFGTAILLFTLGLILYSFKV
jgi:uncharacterized membrane protein